jgi:hypothetical protein
MPNRTPLSEREMMWLFLAVIAGAVLGSVVLAVVIACRLKVAIAQWAETMSVDFPELTDWADHSQAAFSAGAAWQRRTKWRPLSKP